MRRKVKVVFEFETDFESYEFETKDNRALASIKRQIKEHVKEELAFLPLYVDPNVADCTSRSKKMKVNVEFLNNFDNRLSHD